jgi:hypothetical protein
VYSFIRDVHSSISRILLHIALGNPSSCSVWLGTRSLLNFLLFEDSFPGFSISVLYTQYIQYMHNVHSNLELQWAKDATEDYYVFLFWFECSFCRDPTERVCFASNRWLFLAFASNPFDVFYTLQDYLGQWLSLGMQILNVICRKQVHLLIFLFKGTVSPDGFGFWWHLWLVLGLNRYGAIF